MNKKEGLTSLARFDIKDQKNLLTKPYVKILCWNKKVGRKKSGFKHRSSDLDASLITFHFLNNLQKNEVYLQINDANFYKVGRRLSSG